jgi:hypothetical protein
LYVTTSTFAFAGIDVSLRSDYDITPTVRSFALNGIAASLLQNKRLTAESRNFAVLGNNTALSAARKLSATLRTYAFTGNAANLSHSHLLSPVTGTFIYTTQDANLRYGRALIAGTGVFFKTEYDAQGYVGRKLISGTGALNLAGVVVTFEHELVPLSIIKGLEAAGVKVSPSSQSFQYSQDKAAMRQKLAAYPAPKWRVITDAKDCFEFPFIAKKISGGYDGRGVWKISNSAELEGVLKENPQILIEELIDFDCEIAVMVARSAHGQCRLLAEGPHGARLHAPAGGAPNCPSHAR